MALYLPPILHNNKLNTTVNSSDFTYQNNYLTYWLGDTRYVLENAYTNTISGINTNLSSLSSSLTSLTNNLQSEINNLPYQTFYGAISQNGNSIQQTGSQTNNLVSTTISDLVITNSIQLPNNISIPQSSYTNANISMSNGEIIQTDPSGNHQNQFIASNFIGSISQTAGSNTFLDSSFNNITCSGVTNTGSLNTSSITNNQFNTLSGINTGSTIETRLTNINNSISSINTHLSNEDTSISNINSELITINNQLSNVSYSSGVTTFSDNVVVSGNLNGISNSIYSYLSGLSSNVESTLTTLQYQINSNTSGLANVVSNMTNITYNNSYNVTTIASNYVSLFGNGAGFLPLSQRTSYGYLTANINGQELDFINAYYENYGSNSNTFSFYKITNSSNASSLLFNISNYGDISVLRNINFNGSINNVGSSIFNYISNLSSDAQSQFNNINSSVSSINSSITTINNKNTIYDASFNSINTSINSINSSLTTMNNKDTVYDSSFNSINTSINTINSEIVTIDNSLNTLQSNTTGITHNSSYNYTTLNTYYNQIFGGNGSLLPISQRNSYGYVCGNLVSGDLDFVNMYYENSSSNANAVTFIKVTSSSNTSSNLLGITNLGDANILRDVNVTRNLNAVNVNFTGTINSISASIFNYISNLSSDCQSQINNLSSSISSINSNISSISTNISNIITDITGVNYNSTYNLLFINESVLTEGNFFNVAESAVFINSVNSTPSNYTYNLVTDASGNSGVITIATINFHRYEYIGECYFTPTYDFYKYLYNYATLLGSTQNISHTLNSVTFTIYKNGNLINTITTTPNFTESFQPPYESFYSGYVFTNIIYALTDSPILIIEDTYMDDDYQYIIKGQMTMSTGQGVGRNGSQTATSGSYFLFNSNSTPSSFSFNSGRNNFTNGLNSNLYLNEVHNNTSYTTTVNCNSLNSLNISTNSFLFIWHRLTAIHQGEALKQ